jgi:peroxin-16
MSPTPARYESFLVHNVEAISTLESTLRSLTWFLPGRFRDAELASEACMFSFVLRSIYLFSLII